MDIEEGAGPGNRGFCSKILAGGLDLWFPCMSSLRSVRRRWKKTERCWCGEKGKPASWQRCLECWGEANGGRKGLVALGRMENVRNMQNLIDSQQEAPNTTSKLCPCGTHCLYCLVPHPACWKPFLFKPQDMLWNLPWPLPCPSPGTAVLNNNNIYTLLYNFEAITDTFSYIHYLN